jgi:hypothetical protein
MSTPVALFWVGALLAWAGFSAVLGSPRYSVVEWLWLGVEITGAILVGIGLRPLLCRIAERTDPAGGAEPTRPGRVGGGTNDAGPRHQATRANPPFSSNGSGPHTRHRR